MSTQNEDRASEFLGNLADLVYAGSEFLDGIAEKLETEEVVKKVSSFLDGLTAPFTREEEKASAPEPTPTTSNTYNTTTVTDPFAAFMNEEQFVDRLSELLNRPRARRDFGLG